MRKTHGFIISAAGLGLVVGSLASELGFVPTLMVGVGLGLMLGGVFREISRIKVISDR